MQNPIIFACFQPVRLFPSDLLMEYQILVAIVDILANLKNIDIDKGRRQKKTGKKRSCCPPLPLHAPEAVR